MDGWKDRCMREPIFCNAFQQHILVSFQPSARERAVFVNLWLHTDNHVFPRSAVDNKTQFRMSNYKICLFRYTNRLFHRSEQSSPAFLAYLRTLIRIARTEKRLQTGRTQFSSRHRQTPQRSCPFQLMQSSLRPQHSAFADGHRKVSLGSGALDQGPFIRVMWSVTAQTWNLNF